MQHLLRTYHAIMAGLSLQDDRDRGDVPGWVMVTLMSALLVVALLTVFRNELVELVRNAFSSVNNVR